MSNWALIVGVDNYDLPTYLLKGAVKDALSFLSWCIDPNGGAVPVANVNLLLDKGQDDLSVVPKEITSLSSATRDNFVLAMESVLKDSASVGERFFFYFAGHGITVRAIGADLPCICLRNFSPRLTNNAMNLLSIFERLRATQFKEQYFLIDACRNIPFSGESNVSAFDRSQQPVGQVWPQFIAYATQPRNTAGEVADPGYEGGVFTASLLDALRGRGSAKQWDAENGRYIVTWNSLFKFVEARVLAKKVLSTVTTGVIQAPKQFGERGTEDPTLAIFDEGAFEEEELQVDLDPRAAGSDVRLTFGEYGRLAFDRPPPISPVPLKVSLMPRIYSIVAEGTRYRSKKRMALVEHYESQCEPIKIEMELAPPGPTPPQRGITVTTRGPSHGDDVGSLDKGAARGGAPRAPGRGPSSRVVGDSLPREVSSPDALAQLEIAHQSGRIVASGRGRVSLPPTSEAGFYRARIIAPDGSITETLVEMSSNGHGKPVSVFPEPRMTRGLSWATRRAGIAETSGRLLVPSEAIGAAAFVKLSTLLALAVGARVESNGGPPGGKLRSIPLPDSDLRAKVNEIYGGVHVVMGDELMEMNWTDCRISVSPICKPTHESALDLQVSDESPTIASAEGPLEPGQYWLHIRGQGVAAIALAIAVLSSRITLVVVTLEDDRSLDLHQYSLLVLKAGQLARPSYMDPQFSGARFTAIRRIELMQRSYQSGRTTPSQPDIEYLLYQKWADPVAGCLGGYILVRQGRSVDLETPITNLCEHFGSLPDAWVLRAAFEDVAKPDSVEATVMRALDIGVPTFADGVRILQRLMLKWKVDVRTTLIGDLAQYGAGESLFTALDQTTFHNLFSANSVGAIRSPL